MNNTVNIVPPSSGAVGTGNEIVPRLAREIELPQSGLDFPAGDAQNLQLRRLHQYMRGYYWLAVLLLILGAAVGGYAGFRGGRKMYLSTGLIRVMPVVPKVMYSIEDKGTLPMFDSFVDSQAAVLQSQRVFGKAMEDPEWQALGRGTSDRSVEDYSNEITVSHEGGMLRVQAVDPDPNAAVINVRTLINAYVKVYDDEDAQTGETRLDLLRKSKTELTGQWNTVHQEIYDIANLYGTDDLKAKCQGLQERVNKLEDMIQEKRIVLATTARTSSTTRPAEAPPTEEQLARVDSRLAALLQESDKHNQALTEYAAENVGPQNPMMLREKILLEQNELAIKQRETELQKIYAGHDGALSPNGIGESEQQLTDDINGLKHEEDTINEQLKATGKDMLKIEQLRTDANEIQAQRDEVDRRIDELQMEAQITGRLEVLSHGDRPLRAFKDTRITYSAAGGFGGGMLGFLIVAGFAFMDRRLRSPDQAEGGAISAPMLGMLPRLPEDLSDPAQAVMAAHCVHEIRTLLQIWSRRSRHRVFAVTSPNPGAGKTSLTLALGASYATANLRTLIVDCDLVAGGLTHRAELFVKRMLGQILLRQGLITPEQLAEALRQANDSGKQIGQVILDLGYITPRDLEIAIASQIEQPVGILDAMHGVPIDECVAATSIPNLQILPVGSATARDVPLLSPEALHQLIDSLGRAFDVVLVDTGPILGSLEASLVSGIVDGVVLAVRKGDKRPAFDRAMSQLVTVGARVAGVVFNGATPDDIMTYGRASSGARSQVSGVNGDATVAAVDTPVAPKSYGPLTSAVANFAPAPNRNSARQ
jgi:Mrp family chromosome partitioning ATPase/uncharacterized protein involved in exopolysaccharide biosynthesis